MKLRIELHDSVISQVVQKGAWLEIQFKKFVILDVKDHFGFDFDSMPPKQGIIKLKNPKYKTLPMPGQVLEGRIRLGDLSYENCLPLDLVVRESCLLHLVQEAGDHVVFADELEVSVFS